MLSSVFLSLGLLSMAHAAVSVEPVSDTLHAVTLTADKGVTVSRADTLLPAGSMNVSDVLMRNSAFHVGDNGGPAGLKTVSLRGLGSAHTSIYIDGVRVGNLQSGQNDLGMVGFENLASVVVDYAQNSVSFNTARPVFGNGSVSADVRLYAASFGTWTPSARLDFRLSERLSLSASASGLVSRGDFRYGDGLERVNNDVRQIRGGLDLFGSMDGGGYHVKVYYNDVDRGTPGSADWPSDDRQKDRNAFVQGVFRKNFSHLYTLHLSGKASYDDICYSSSWGDSRYGQTEFQLNSVHDFQIRRWWKISFAADIQWDGLKSSAYNASRLTALSALATSFRSERISAEVALEYLGTSDRDALSRHAFSPSVNIRMHMLEGLDVIAYARRAYRVPVFNELYYAGYGNPDLKSEDAWLADLGADYDKSIVHGWRIKARIDGFLNHLTDKIISSPSEEDPNIWMPFNIGKVRSAGFDASAGFVHQGEWNYSFEAKYSFQAAVDRTPDSATYGQQIPYIARHVVVLTADAAWKGWTLNPVWQMKGGRTDGYGSLPDWNTVDLTLAKSISMWKAGSLTFRFSARNIFDCRYETVSGYPMPGRSFMCGINYVF